jgi:hypothetical protein
MYNKYSRLTEIHRQQTLRPPRTDNLRTAARAAGATGPAGTWDRRGRVPHSGRGGATCFRPPSPLRAPHHADRRGEPRTCTDRGRRLLAARHRVGEGARRSGLFCVVPPASSVSRHAPGLPPPPASSIPSRLLSLSIPPLSLLRGGRIPRWGPSFTGALPHGSGGRRRSVAGSEGDILLATNRGDGGGGMGLATREREGGDESRGRERGKGAINVERGF